MAPYSSLACSHIYLLAVLAIVGVANAANLQTHAIPHQVKTSEAFQVKARPRQGAWQQVNLFHATVHEIDQFSGNPTAHDTSVGLFDFDGPVEVTIEPSIDAFPEIESVRVRPLSYGIEAVARDRQVSLTLDEPRNIVVEINRDLFNVLHLFLASPEPAAMENGANNTIHFEPGYHQLNQTVQVASGQTVYLAPGAVVNGSFNFTNATDAALVGRGVLYHSRENAVLVDYSQNIRIQGITVLNPGHYSVRIGSSDNVVVANFRSISAVKWGDGIDVFCSRNVVLEKLFMRNSDDCVAIYQHRWDYYRDSKNITLRDSALWADVAHPVHIGLHGNVETPETMEDVTVSNIDILDHREPQVDYQGCLAINCGDENLIKNVLFQDIRVEDFRLGMLFTLRILYNSKYNKAPGRGIHNVTFKNITYNGTANMPIIAGYDADRRVEFVDFQGLNINGKHVWDGMEKPGWYSVSDYVPMYVGGHVANLTWST